LSIWLLLEEVADQQGMAQEVLVALEPGLGWLLLKVFLTQLLLVLEVRHLLQIVLVVVLVMIRQLLEHLLQKVQLAQGQTHLKHMVVAVVVDIT
jgi:hypothetical protein